MTNYNLEEAELIKAQIFLSFILLFSDVISILLSYNFLLILEEKTPIYSDKDNENILFFNRTLVTLVSAIFIYINIKDKGIKEKYNLEREYADLQIDASIFNFIAALIVFYVDFNSENNLVADENPTS